MYLRDFLPLNPSTTTVYARSAFYPYPAFYSQSAVCILHSVCILPLDRSLHSAVRNLRFTLTVKADTRYFSKKHQQIFLLDAIFFEQ